MFKTGFPHVLFVLALSICLVSSSAEARRWRHFYGAYGYSYTLRHGDDNRRERHAEVVVGRPRTGGGDFGAVIDRLIRGCMPEATGLQNLPFDDITRITAPDDKQRAALEALRASAHAAAERVSAQCPQDKPAPPSARLEAVQQAIDAATATFAAIDPPLRAFYAALDDEQKARLLRDLTLSKTQPGQEVRSRQREIPAAIHDREDGAWEGICERFASALRGWPISEIERRGGLSQPQRAALYELVSSSLRVAETLASACPTDTALTPPARMALLRTQLLAVRQATVAIRPALEQFYESLDQGQKVYFAAMR